MQHTTPWLDAVRASLETGWRGHDVLIVTCHSPWSAEVTESRLRRMVGPGPRLIMLVESGTPGNLVGTLQAWRAAVEQAKQRGWDLQRLWREGELTAAVVHNAGIGKRASPLTHAEDNERGALLLPGRLGSQPARLLEAVVAQCSPLAISQLPGQLDVLWSSQLFVPQTDPTQVPQVHAPLVKLLSLSSSPDALADVGTFALNGSQIVDFAAQGTLEDARAARTFAQGRPLGLDLGSFRIRHDLIDALSEAYLDQPMRGPRDLDPHFTAPALALLNRREAGPYGPEVQPIIDRMPSPLVAGCSLGTNLPWWRLRRPEELRQAALDLRPSIAKGAPLRTLLGIDHPVQRSWLGGVWVEGPELSWQTVRDGTTIGAVHVQDAIVQDCALWAGRADVHTSVVCHSTGALTARDALVMACGSDGLRAHGGLAWRVSDRAPSKTGLAHTYSGLCAVDRPRLVDGRAIIHGFLGQDGKRDDEAEQDGLGLSWAQLRALPRWRGPDLASALNPALDERAPHLVHDIPPDVLRLLQETLPQHTDLHRWASLAAEGAFRLALHRGGRPRHNIDGALVLGRRWHDDDRCYHLHLDLETWQRWKVAPQRLAEALIRCWSEHLCTPSPAGRTAWAERRLADWRAGTLGASTIAKRQIGECMRTGDAHALLMGVDRWHSPDDPDRCDLAAWFDALDNLRAGARDITDAASLRGWLRWRLDHVQDNISDTTNALQLVDPDVLRERGFSWSHPWLVDERWVPDWDLRPQRAPADRCDAVALAEHLLHDLPRVIGIAGPAASGKSTLTRAVQAALMAKGRSVTVVHADALTWQGPGFRYVQHEEYRDSRLFGPGIYDDRAIAAATTSCRTDHLIIDGVFVGLDIDVRAQIDVLVAVLLADSRRLSAKFQRDAVRGHRRIDVVTDFARKVQHESRDGVQSLLSHAQWIWDRGTGELWARQSANALDTP